MAQPRKSNLVHLHEQPKPPTNLCLSPAASKTLKAYTSSLSQPCSGGAARAVDVFTRSTYIDILLDSLRYCQKEKGLRVHAWCVMSNHVHLMISTQFGHHPSDALRDLKKFTSKKIIAAIEDKEQPESRRATRLPTACCGFSRARRSGVPVKRMRRTRSTSFGNKETIPSN